MSAEPAVLRLRILTSSRYEFPGEAEQVCLNEGTAAVGWPVDFVPQDWGAYYQRAIEIYGRRGANTVERLVQAESGTLVWLRDRVGCYHLGELHGSWQYDRGSRASRLDIANCRPCRWLFTGSAMEVPGVVIRAFTGPGQAVRPIESDSVARFSRALADGKGLASACTSEDVIRDLLDDTDVEDLVALYLQYIEGLIVVPPDRQRGHPGYDLEFVSPSGRRGVVQVKSGAAAYDLESLTSEAGEKWAFASSGVVTGEGTVISVARLAAFLDEARDWLPKKLSRWFS